MKINTAGKNNRVYGGLLGHYKGDKCIIYTAFEFVNLSADDNQMTNFDISYIEDRRKLTEQLYPNYEIVGFFSTNTTLVPEKNDEEVIKLMEYFGVITPVYLMLGTDLANVEELPVATYKIEKTSKSFTKVEHVLEGNESERVCLETVTRSGDVINNESAIVQNMETIKNAIGVLKSNLKTIKNSLNNPAFLNDPHYISLLNEISYNYPDANNSDHLKFIKEKEEETLILNNLCASSINVSLQGRIDSLKFIDEKKYNR
jgi:hypothetical protein